MKDTDQSRREQSYDSSRLDRLRSFASLGSVAHQEGPDLQRAQLHHQPGPSRLLAEKETGRVTKASAARRGRVRRRGARREAKAAGKHVLLELVGRERELFHLGVGVVEVRKREIVRG